MIKVAVNGFGTIGRRVADAVNLQEDMDLIGVAKTSPDYVARIASLKYKIFVPGKKEEERFEAAGIPVAGTVEDMVEGSDIIVDATPEGVGETNLKLYRERRKRAIFQGGEDASIAEESFNAYANYSDSRGKNYVRVVSCNTTGLARTIATLRDGFGIKSVYATLIRRATDQNDSKKGPINAIEPTLKIPSHQGPDLQTVVKGIDAQTVAIKVPTTLMHVHVLSVDIEHSASTEDVISALSGRRRIMVTSGSDGKTSTAQLMDMARELGRSRGDLFEIAIWKESVRSLGNRVNLIQAVHQESDVVPENVDAIRSMFELCDREDSIERTDRSLGIKGGLG